MGENMLSILVPDEGFPCNRNIAQRPCLSPVGTGTEVVEMLEACLSKDSFKIFSGGTGSW